MSTNISRRTLLGALSLATVGAMATPLSAHATPTTTPAASTPTGHNVIVFVVAHQDDELMSCGSSILSHKTPSTRVIVVCATDGSATRARHTIADRLGREVTPEQITMYRDAEMRWTVQTGLGAEFVLPPAHLRMKDGQSTLAGTRAIFEWVLATWPGARIKTQTPFDTHNDHRCLGVSATDMHFEGLIPDLRLYVPGYILAQGRSDIPRTTSVRRWEAVDAQAAYRLWSPPPPGSSRVDRYFQVGYTSAGPSFRRHAADPVSRRHAPVALEPYLREGLV